MSIKLQPLIESYVRSMNAQDVPTFIANFDAEAIVHDEGRNHRGAAEIAAWIEDAHQKYQPQLEVEQVTEAGEETIITGVVSGTFEGSPLRLHHHLKIERGKIVSLTIKA